MARKIQVRGANNEMQSATEVGIDESTERWSEIRLKDGTVLQAKVVVVSVARFDDRYDQDGIPVYNVRSQTVVSVVAAPEELKEKV